MEPVTIDLDELQDILEELSIPPDANEKRKNALTQDDVIVIAKIVQAVSHKSCAMGFTKDEITVVKRVVNTLNKGILVVGYGVLTAIGAGLVTLAWWAVKHGIAEIVKGTK